MKIWNDLHFSTDRNHQNYRRDGTGLAGKDIQYKTKKNDDLSRNITNLLENLLKDYDSGQHPEYDTGKSSRWDLCRKTQRENFIEI